MCLASCATLMWLLRMHTRMRYSDCFTAYGPTYLWWPAKEHLHLQAMPVQVSEEEEELIPNGFQW